MLIMVPHALLAGYACWAWWPKTDREGRKFGWVMAYLIAFFSVMYFVFHLG